MTKVFKRILEAKQQVGKSWDQISKEAGIPLASWMTGLPTSQPSDKDLRKIAPVLDTTYEWLKYGRKK